jgi:hypothetical protein
MSIRLATGFLLPLLVVGGIDAKERRVLPAVVLEARTVMIVIILDAREKPSNPKSEQALRDDLEGALEKWGRFLSKSRGTVDLVIVARQGHVEVPTVSFSANDPKSPLHPNSGSTQLDPNTPGLRPDRAGAQRTIDELRLEEDSFEVYQGGVDHPLDAAPVWQYEARLALKGPKVAAVEHFRKAIEESEKSRQKKQ